MKTHRTQWMPVYIEPIPFSGERLCAAIAFRTEDGQTKTISTMPDHAINCLFGTEATGMRRLVHELIVKLEAYVKNGGELAAWTPPFDGVYPSAVRTVRETSLNAAVETIITNVASITQVEPPPKAADKASITWAQAVQKVMLKQSPVLGSLFNVQLKDERDGKITVGFMTSNFAAEFAAINAHYGWSSQSATFYRKLINLTIARRHAAMFRPEHMEILIRAPDRASLDTRGVERLEALLWDAERAASSSGIAIHSYATPENAAKHLREFT